MDDAVLSVGGAMWCQREACEFIVASVAGRTNYTRCYSLDRDYFDVDVVSALRRAESEHFARLIGGRHVALCGTEAPLRYREAPWTLDWFRAHRESVYAFVHHCSPLPEHQTWAREIAKAIHNEAPEEVWMPLGVGTHADHELVRRACLHLLVHRPGLFEGTVVRFYEDLPYANRFPHHAEQIVQAMRSAGAQLDEERVDITAAIAEKLRLMSIYATQFDMDRLGPRVQERAHALSNTQGRYAERLYRLRAPPTADVDAMTCYAHNDAIESLCRRLVPWLRRNRSATLIRVYLLEPAGRFAADMGSLLMAFPQARFEVYVATACIAGTDAVSDHRVSVRDLGAKRHAPLFHAAQILGGALPTVILAGANRKIPAALRVVSCHSVAIYGQSLNHFVLAVRRAIGA